MRGAGYGTINLHPAAATQPRHEGLDDAERRGDGHARVDGVAAGEQDLVHRASFSAARFPAILA